MKKGLIFILVVILVLLVGVIFWVDFQESPAIEDEAQEGDIDVKSKVEDTTRIPIIMYHYVREVDKNADPLGWNLSINPADFEKQLAYLQGEGYVSIHLADLIDGKVPGKSVILSFDDGLEDFYTTALPLLQEYGFTASNGIITGMVGVWEHMTEEQIEECVDVGIEITSHTVTHPNLATLGEEEVRRQIVESRDYLRSTFRVQVLGFVYPAGKYNDMVAKVLAEEGYEIAVTTEHGEADLKKDYMLLLPRVRIDNRDGYEGFVSKLEGFR